MESSVKPKLVFFQFKHAGNFPKFVLLHRQQHVKCLAEFFEVIVINEDCDYSEICDRYQPDLSLFEGGVNYRLCQRLTIENTHSHPQIPKIGLHNGDSWCEARAGFISDMEHWGIETFFTISTTTAEHTPEIAEHLFVWPNFIDPEIYHDYSQPKSIPILFTGRQGPLYPWRDRIQRLVTQFYPSLICPHLGYECQATQMLSGERYARTINASWFVPTCGTIAKEIVRKHLEIPAAKSCLLTEKTPVLEAAGFKDMENCVFADDSDILDKLDELFQNPDRLEAITHAGYQLAHSRHTLKHRSQILEWFNFHKNLKFKEKIVQINPFQPLQIVENSSLVKPSPIICHGYHLELLQLGNEQLRHGQYEQAITFYLKAVNFISWMPELRFKLALCHLYLGKAKEAQSWLFQSLEYTLEIYKALDPDPVEWAYFIISLLGQGELKEASQQASRFPRLQHPELTRIRWVIHVLNSTIPSGSVTDPSPNRYRHSLHQLPDRTFNDWLENLCLILTVCQQSHWPTILLNAFTSQQKPLKETRSFPKLNSTHSSFQNSSEKVSLNSQPQLIVWIAKIKFKLRNFVLKNLNFLERKVGYFLPYYLSEKRNNEFFRAIEKIAREQKIDTALLIGATTGEGTTEALLTGILDNSNKPKVFCLNVFSPQFIKLQKQYSNQISITFFKLSNTSLAEFQREFELQIQEIKQKYNIESFDLILVDGSEFSLKIGIDKMGETKLIVLDDLHTKQNSYNYQKLLSNPYYRIIESELSHQGYAFFQRLDETVVRRVAINTNDK